MTLAGDVIRVLLEIALGRPYVSTLFRVIWRGVIYVLNDGFVYHSTIIPDKKYLERP